MARKTTSIVLLLFSGLSLWGGSNDPKPTVSKDPLSADQIAVYRAFLKFYDNGAAGTPNVGNVTIPLQLHDDEKKGCLKGIALENAVQARTTIHSLGPEIAEGRKLKFVDPEQQRKAVHEYEDDPSRTMRQGNSVEEGY
jgi:hypothetical protein